MTEMEKLRFQNNIENIKEYVRDAFNGEEVFMMSEGYYCTGCHAIGKGTLKHTENCRYVAQQEARCILKAWVS